MTINLQKFIPVIISLSILFLPLMIQAQNDKAQLNNSIIKNEIKTKILSPNLSTYINEDFSTASAVTPPAGWTQYIIIGVEGVDLWHFDNPGGRTINLPMSDPVAIFDDYNYSSNGQPENVALESPAFTSQAGVNLMLEWYQYYNASGDNTIFVEVWEGSNWITVYSSSESTVNPQFNSLDISAYAAGIAGAKIRFRWTANTSGFWMIDNVMVYEPQDVPEPAVAVFPSDGGTDIDINSSLEWAAGSGPEPTGYRLYFGTDGGGVIPPTNIENNSNLYLTTSYTPTAPLLYGTTYYWMVVPYNEGGDAAGNQIWSFTVMTDPPVTTFPYLEDFEGTFPPLYYIRYSGLLSDSSSLNSTISGWEQDDWRNISTPANKAARLSTNGLSQNYWLATTLIDLDSETSYQLEFDLSLNAAGTSNPPELTGNDDKFAVVISTDSGKTWSASNVLRLWDNTGSPNVYNDINYLGEHHIIDLSEYSGLIQIAFYGESTIVNADNDIMVDNIEIKQIPIAAPEFSINPTELDFGSVIVGGDSILPATITNSGSNDLIITNITSTNTQFTFLPATFPVTITPGGNQTFDVEFTPLNTGTQSAQLEIIHNAAGSPVDYSVQGTGVDNNPAISVSPALLNFGNVEVNSINELVLTVSNIGLSDTLEVTGISVSSTEFSVAPQLASIPAGESQSFTVVFQPGNAGVYSGNLILTSNDPDSPDTVLLIGSAAFETGLIFSQDTVFQQENKSYTQTICLTGLDPLSEKIQAIQFRLAVNKNLDDNIILTFQSLQKGSDVADENWVLDYNLFRGPITGNGASVDSVYVLLYNLDQYAGLDPTLNYNDLLKVKYRVAKLPALNDTLKSSLIISNAQATTQNGYPVNITSPDNELTVMALNGIPSYGDVNGDGYLDILDLIMVVDHIVGRDSLSGDYFTRADISPWLEGTPAPEPDGLVNVQDLSLIQNIILTGIYPDNSLNGGGNNTPVEKLSEDYDAKVIFYVNKEGISVYVDNKIDIRGCQFELNNINVNPDNMFVSTDLGKGYYYRTSSLLRALLYDRLAEKYIVAGKNFVADIPVRLEKPEDITAEKVILVDINKNRVAKTEVEIVYGAAPDLPLDYILYQNYPNPFNPNTTVSFQVPQSCHVKLIIYNILGQEVKKLFSEQISQGKYSVQWDGLNEEGERMASGTYIYRITAGDFIQSKKMILLK